MQDIKSGSFRSLSQIRILQIIMKSIIEKMMNKAKEITPLINKEKGKIHIVTHHDADGISSGAIIFRALEILGKDITIDVVRQLEDEIIKNISKKSADLFIFTDLGSGQKEIIGRYIKETPVIIIDHHQKSDYTSENIHEFNCHDFGVDGKDEISGSGMTYILCRELTPKIKDMSEFILIGAAGDTQKKDGMFISLNKYLLEEVKTAGRIQVKTGLRLFGRYTRPLHRSLMYCDRPKIPHVNNNESGAVQMMADLNLSARKKNGEWTTLSDLSDEEEMNLITEIILRTDMCDNGENLVGNVYILPNNFELREFATMLNACGRMNKGNTGLDLCLGKIKNIDTTLLEYRRKIAKYLAWVNRNKNVLIKKKNAVYLVARDNVDENFIGTVMSIISKSKDNPYKIMFGFANSDNGVKVSSRADSSLADTVNLGKAILKVVEDIGGEGGGHSLAAGAKIPAGVELEFIEKIDPLLEH